MTVSAILTTHNNWDDMEQMYSQLKAQKHRPSQIIILASNTPKDDFEEHIYHEPNYADWGHQKRAKGITLATGDYLGFFNDDDTYSSKYLQKLLTKAKETAADIIACDFVSHLAPGQINLTEPKIGRITSGNFIVRTSLAKKVGYISRSYQADGQFIEDLMSAGATFARVSEVLYVHN